MDVWDQLWWTLAAYLVVRLLARGRPRLWLLVGAVAGLGLLTKLTMLTMLLFGLGLAAGLLLSPARAHLRARWVWLGGLVAAAGLVPYALWNAAHGWPTPAFWGHYGAKVAGGSAPDFLLQQVITMNPLTLPLWLAGLWWLLWAPAGRPYRALGWAYLVLLALLAAVHAKSYFLAPAYTWLYAAGALVAEGATRAALASRAAALRRGPAPERAPLRAVRPADPPAGHHRPVLRGAGGRWPAPMAGRPPRLGRADGGGGRGPRRAAPGRARRGLRPHGQLRRGRGDRPARPGARAAARHQRAQ